MRRSGRAAFAVAIVAALLFVGVVGNYATRVAGAANVEVDPTSTLAVTATDTFSFTPDEVSDLPLSTTITVDFTNGDASDTVHTFTILGCEGRSIPVGTDDVTPWINGSKCGAPLFNLQGGTGLHKGTLNVSTSGWYMFLCTQPGHFAKNMYGYISFGVALPANLTIAASNLGPGLAVFIIVGTIVTLTVIAIVLGFVVGRRDGARHEMPPERLGYAEP
ncbi:MAG: hypothetical protein WBG19_04100, partial [Thermoplasmata archaeon]